MPQDEDYRFGKELLRRGLLTQEQLEECVELLCALERMGGQRRLWELVVKKKYLSLPEVQQVRGDMAAEAARARVSPPQPPSPRPAEEMKSSPSPESSSPAEAVRAIPKSRPALGAGEGSLGERAAAHPGAKRTPPPLKTEEIAGAKFRMVHIAEGREVRSYPLPQRPVNIGSAQSADIILSGTGVSPQHARVTTSTSEGRVAIWDPGAETGIFINGKRRTSCDLKPGDLIKCGECMLLFLPVLPSGETAPEPINAEDAPGGAVAKLECTDGPRAGVTFYVGTHGFIIGRDRAAQARCEESGLAPFHAHLVSTPEGLLFTDLGSREGTKLNGRPMPQGILQNDDKLTTGPLTFVVQLMRLAGASTPEQPPDAVATVQVAPASLKKEEAESNLGWEVPTEISFRDSDSSSLQRPEGSAPAEPRYGPGDLQLTCLAGPTEGEVFPLNQSINTIGRDRKAEVCIQDLSVSRRHALIVFTESGPEVRDLGSRNGVHVNARRIQTARLRVGDIIRVGMCLFQLDLQKKETATS